MSIHLVFDDPELEQIRRVNVPDDASEWAQMDALFVLAKQAYTETAVRPEIHRAIAGDEATLWTMVGQFGARLEWMEPLRIADRIEATKGEPG